MREIKYRPVFGGGDIVRCLLVFLLASSSIFAAQNAYAREDQNKDKSAEIAYVNSSGKLTGVFGVEENITRGELVTTLFRYINPDDTSTRVVKDYAKNTTKFTDNEDGKFYTSAVNWAQEKGVLTGDSSIGYTTVRPNDPITREDSGLKYSDGLHLLPQDNATRSQTAKILTESIKQFLF